MNKVLFFIIITIIIIIIIIIIIVVVENVIVKLQTLEIRSPIFSLLSLSCSSFVDTIYLF